MKPVLRSVAESGKCAHDAAMRRTVRNPETNRILSQRAEHLLVSHPGLGKGATPSKVVVAGKGYADSLARNLVRHPMLYAMALPCVIFLAAFYYVPMMATVIAWKDYNIFLGVLGSPWVGWKNFETLFSYADFYQILFNTVILGVYMIGFGFAPPIVLALLLNEVRSKAYQRTIQSISYVPHFLSWVVVSQIVIKLLSPSTGVVNIILSKVFGVQPIYFMVKAQLFRPILTLSTIWKEIGFSSVIYLAALTSIDPQLYESAAIEGATRWQQTRHITIPCLQPVILTMLILAVGRFLTQTGFDQIWNMMNPLVYSVADTLETYTYRAGLINGRYSLTTAIGLFSSVVNFALLWSAHLLSKKITGRGLLPA